MRFCPLIFRLVICPFTIVRDMYGVECNSDINGCLQQCMLKFLEEYQIYLDNPLSNLLMPRVHYQETG